VLKVKKKEIDGRRGDELDLREDGKGKGVGACALAGFWRERGMRWS